MLPPEKVFLERQQNNFLLFNNKNQTMKKADYKSAIHSVEIELAKSPSDVFNHLINLKKWWPEDFEGEDIKLNSEFISTTGDSHYSKKQDR